MKLVKRDELKSLPVGTCFFPVKHDGTPDWNEFNIISSQSKVGFIGVMPVVPYFSRYLLMEKGEAEADNDTIDTRYWDYERDSYFAVLNRAELESMREAINYALDREDLE